MLPVGDWQRSELARSVTLPILRWFNNRWQRTTLRAATEPECLCCPVIPTKAQTEETKNRECN